MFDTCLLLSSGGNVVYSGPQRLALPYMAFLGFYIPPNENLADFLLDVISGTCGVLCRLVVVWGLGFQVGCMLGAGEPYSERVAQELYVCMHVCAGAVV
jgi:hypothetical protein